jgi:hypothetical protein
MQMQHQSLATKKLAVFPHPPYSPDLAPCDVFFILIMQLELQLHRLQDLPEIQEQSLTVLHEIPQVSSNSTSNSGKNAGTIA